EMVRGNSACTCSGRAEVATSKSLGISPSNSSRTHPPAKRAWCPAARRVRTTSRANSRGGIRGGMTSLWLLRGGCGRGRLDPEKKMITTVLTFVPLITGGEAIEHVCLLGLKDQD